MVKKQKKNNIIFFVIGLILIVIAIAVAVVLNLSLNDSVKKTIDNLVSSGQNEVIFFERDGDETSERFREILDGDLKKYGIQYTVINLSQISSEDQEYIAQTFDFSDAWLDVAYIDVINGNDIVLSVNKDDIDDTLIRFAKADLLDDNGEVLSDYYFQIGFEAYHDGKLGIAKKYFEKVPDHPDAQLYLQDPVFYLVDHTFRYLNQDLNNYIDIAISYRGGDEYGDGYDYINITYLLCQGRECLSPSVEQYSGDVYVDLGYEFVMRENGSNSFDDTLRIYDIERNYLKIVYRDQIYTLTLES